MKNFDEWNKSKKRINEKIFKGFAEEREIWWCSLGLNIGSEEDGKNANFERPVLVLKKFNRSIILIVPFTTSNNANEYKYKFIHEDITFYVILSQLRLVSTSRFLRKIRKINTKLFEEIKWQIIMKVF